MNEILNQANKLAMSEYLMLKALLEKYPAPCSREELFDKVYSDKKLNFAEIKLKIKSLKYRLTKKVKENKIPVDIMPFGKNEYCAIPR